LGNLKEVINRLFELLTIASLLFTEAIQILLTKAPARTARAIRGMNARIVDFFISLPNPSIFTINSPVISQYFIFG